MIPKIIHYCWFGRNPLPPLAEKCVASWRKFLPGYEIKEWNEDNFDVNIIPYTAEAYRAKKYAFVSDYARFWILYHEGGLYFDTDVEVIRPMDDIIERGPFMGCETDGSSNGGSIKVAPGLGLGVASGLHLYEELLALYDGLHFQNIDGSYNQITIVQYTTEVLNRYGLENKSGIQCVDGVYIYPSEYFCPRNIVSKKMHITQNTRSIHHYMASWSNKRRKETLKKIMRLLLPESFLMWYHKVKHTLQK